jgi:hypothetical protein
MVFARLVHNLIELATASMTLLGLVAFLFFGVGHKLASALVFLLHRGGLACAIGESQLVFASASIKVVFAIGMLVG